MSAPSVADIQAHIETDLSSAAITRLIQDAEQEVISRYGPEDAQTDDLPGDLREISLSRRVDSASDIDTVVETVGDEETELEADDYEVSQRGWRLLRKSTGTNGRMVWGRRVVVTYAPSSDTARRTRIIIDLVRLAIQFNALKNESIGDYSSQSADYQAERERIMSVLDTRQRNFA